MQVEKNFHRCRTGAHPMLWVALLSFPAWLAAQPAQAAAPDGLELFESKIRPLLVERCQKCHGAQKQWAGLRLDSRAAALTGGDSGPALVAGKPDESELISRLTDADDEVRMPPLKEGARLSDEQIASFKQWIQLGAPWPESKTSDAQAKEKLWREHWAFQAIKRVEPPGVKDAERVRNAIDQFTIATLEAAGLQLSPEADRRTLIRRATYDLTGLPPTPEEVSEFVNDVSPDAYERLIDRLLASPQYGEQWGRYWLDIARYSDTKGYVYTREHRFFVHSSHYRDWVIRAFNKDLPYDRFVVLQLAADLAAPEEPEALAAMGFLTLGRRMLGVTPDIIEDRIDMVGRGLLGLTVGCARCHDHKFDPIPTADYYSLYGVFQNCVERQVPLPRQADAKAPELDAELEKLQKKLAETIALRSKETSQRVRSRIAEYLAAQQKLEDYSDLGVIPVVNKDELIPGFVRRWEAYLKEAAKREDPVFAAWTAYARLPADQFAGSAAEINKQLLANPEKINPRVAKAFATPPTSVDEVCERYAKLFNEIDAKWTKTCSEAKAADLPTPKSLPDPADEALRQVLHGEDSPCLVPDEPIVNTEYFWDLKTVEEIWKLQSKVDVWLLQHRNQAPHAVVLNDRDKLVDPQVFRRGNAMNKTEAVPRQFLEVAAGRERKPFAHGSGRLELAQAITDPSNPFTSRVWINRVWLQHFGEGLVTTPSDFGVRSERPSHPELLDWLASELIEHGWSTKWLHRTIMLSATYRQSSARPADAAELALVQERDPGNRLLWRMNPRRLSFEQFRDTLIATSHELDKTMGGKGADLLGPRRSVYVLVDRQYLPTVFSVFDFASPDFHSSQRAETTNPQQALFALNSPYLADRARKIAGRNRAEASTAEGRVHRAYQAILQRNATAAEIQAAIQFLAAATTKSSRDDYAAEAKAWSYGYGEIDIESGIVKSFQKLPHFTGSAWQGGPMWPNSTLGWAQLTARGGHVGNDHKHAVIRRWTASTSGTISIKSEMVHQDVAGDGVRCWIVSNQDKMLNTASVYNQRKQLDVETLEVEPGETIDFVVDVGKTLNSDQFVWVPTITQTIASTSSGGSSSEPTSTTWNSEDDFPRIQLLPLEQFVQLLLFSNELMFVD
jgi:cytochrome c553